MGAILDLLLTSREERLHSSDTISEGSCISGDGNQEMMSVYYSPKLIENGTLRLDKGRVGFTSSGPSGLLRSGYITMRKDQEFALYVNGQAGIGTRRHEFSSTLFKVGGHVNVETFPLAGDEAQWSRENFRQFSNYGKERILTVLMCFRFMKHKISQSIPHDVVVDRILPFLADFRSIALPGGICPSATDSPVQYELQYEVQSPPSTALFFRVDGGSDRVMLKSHTHGFLAEYRLVTRSADPPPMCITTENHFNDT